MNVYSNIENINEVSDSNLIEMNKQQLLKRLGDNIEFEDNTWVCDKLKDSVAKPHSYYTLYFNCIPEEYRRLVKYFALMENIRLLTLRNEINNLSHFFSYLKNECDSLNIKNTNKMVLNNFEIYLNRTSLSKKTKNAIWHNTYKFFFVLNGFKELPQIIPVSRVNPWMIKKKDIRIDDKYIPQNITQQLDNLFRNEELPLYYRVVYWIMRSIPSRVSEVVGMKIDCIRPFMKSFIITIPSWKQNGGYQQPQLRNIHVKYEGHGKYLIDLIKEQQYLAGSLQHKVSEDEKGMLFTVNSARYQFITGNNSYNYIYERNAKILHSNIVTLIFKLCCRRYNITNENGEIYKLSSHQLRHNGITDRLYAGFSTIEVRDMTAHQGDTMMIDSYKHIIPEKNKELQKRVISDKVADNSKVPVYFRGRILNLDKRLESRLLQNPRAYMISDGSSELGICTDILGCKGNVFECLSCERFGPKVESVEFYEKQIKLWQGKCVLFKNQKAALENAEYNLSLYEGILSKIKVSIKDVYGE